MFQNNIFVSGGSENIIKLWKYDDNGKKMNLLSSYKGN